MVADFINTMLELSSVFFTYLLLTQIPVRKWNVALYFGLSVPLSLLFASIDHPIIYINFLLIAALQIVSLRSDLAFTESCLFASISFLLIGYLELMAYSLMPVSWLQTDLANYISNIPILILTVLLYSLSKHYHIANTLRSYIKQFKYWIIGVLVFILLFGQSYLSRLSSLWTYLPGFITLFVFLSFLLVIVVSIYYTRSADKLRVSVYEQHVEKLDHFVHSLRRYNHDYKHHIHHIISQVESASDLQALRSDLRSYVDQIEEDRYVTSSLQAIEQPLFRSVLYGAYLRCQTENIPFTLTTTELLPSFPLKDYQLVEVLENLLSNAIEHNIKLEPEKRWLNISLSVQQHESHSEHSVTISNAILQSLSLKDLQFTSKKSSSSDALHGIGLSSVKETLGSHQIPLYVQLDSDSPCISFSFSYTTKERTL